MKLKYALAVLFAGTALGSFGLLHSAANAALVCTPGNIVGTGTCTETVTFGPALTDLSNQTLTLDKWISNASPGFVETLLGVSFTFGGNISSSGTLTNNAAGPETFNFSIGTDFKFSAGAGAPANFLPSPLDATGTIGPVAITNLSPGGSVPFSGNIPLTPATLAVVGSLAGFLGPGTFNALVSTLTGETVQGGGGNIAFNGSTLATPQIDLTYTFEIAGPNGSTPIPGALPLFATGLGALGLFGWRRKQKTAAPAA